jgi:hypothetical protein
MNQNQNWIGSHKGPAANNADKQINTRFYTVGGEFAINPNWAIMAELPTYARHLTTTDDGTVFGAAGSIYTGKLTDLGDASITANYTGLSSDMSTGLIFGVKLPTGNDTGPTGTLGGAEFDRDSLPGTGSTDLIFGGYHVGALNAAGTLNYFAQLRTQWAVLTRDSYRPGNEFDEALGVSYSLGQVSYATNVTPLLQFLGSVREHDTGDAADPLNSGYQRLLISPGLNVRFNQISFYGDVEIPIAQHTNAAQSVAIEGTQGQLVAPVLFKLQIKYDF